MHPRWTRKLLSERDFDAIARAVADAESHCAADIRVHLERRMPRGAQDAMARAREVFAALEMHRTTHRNGVLVYLALRDRKLAIVGDDGIHARVGDEYWAAIRDRMVEALKAGAPREAIVTAVREIGEALARWFPRRRGAVHQLDDDVTVS